jgi:hypothetical protein
MRAVGYAMAPLYLLIGALDLALYTRPLAGEIYIGAFAAGVLSFLWLGSFTLARTHAISLPRGFLVALLPAVVISGVTLARASLELTSIPGIAAPQQPYYVP